MRKVEFALKRALMMLVACGAASVFARANKYVAAGWEFAESDVEELLQRADAFDRTALDGCVLYLTEGDGDCSSLVAENCQRGCFTYATGKLRFEPGDIFGLTFSAKGRHVSATINWMKDGKWNWDLRPMIVPIDPKTDPNGWTRTDWSFSIPEDADGFGVQLGVGQGVGEKCWFDNIAVIPARAIGK